MGCPQGIRRSLEAHPEIASVAFDAASRTFTLTTAPGQTVTRDDLRAWIATAAKAEHEAWRLAD